MRNKAGWLHVVYYNNQLIFSRDWIYLPLKQRNLGYFM